MFSPNFSTSTQQRPGANTLYEVMQTIGHYVTVKKGKAIIKEGSHSRCIVYLISGILKTVKDVREKDYILGFSFAEDIACCPTSLLNGMPNNFTIEAVTDSEVLICDWKDFEQFADESTYTSVIKYLLVYNLAFVEHRLVDAISLTAEQGYRRLQQKDPARLKQIPLSLVASYLGISLERLSRIRRKMKLDICHIIQ